ncbi:MAG: hypothetical protein ACKVU2_06100 [Saprospiraceae bacterium]
MPARSIDNLEDLLAEKARLSAQIHIVEKELAASAGRTRSQLGDFFENKFSISKQIGKFFQGDEPANAVGTSAMSALGRAIGLGPVWSGILSALGPMLVRYFRTQLRKRKSGNADEIPVPAAESQPN